MVIMIFSSNFSSLGPPALPLSPLDLKVVGHHTFQKHPWFMCSVCFWQWKPLSAFVFMSMYYVCVLSVILSDSLCIMSVCLAFNCHLHPHPLSLIHCQCAAPATNFLFFRTNQSRECTSKPHCLYFAAAEANFLPFNCLELSPSPENCRFLPPTIGG